MTGYIRQDVTDQISNGNTINAIPLDGEFDAITTAFAAVGGHKHDGSIGEGASVVVIGPAQDIVASANSLTPKTTNTVDLGTTTYRWKDFWAQGSATIVGDLIVDTTTLKVDSTNNRVGVGTVTPAATLNTATTTTGMAVLHETTEDSAAAGPDLYLRRISASPASSDTIGRVIFQGRDSAGANASYAQITTIINDATDGSEDGSLYLQNMVAGTLSNSLVIGGTQVTIQDKNLTLLNNTGDSKFEIGRTDGTTNTPAVEFHSGAVAVDYDAKIIAYGGTGVAGGAYMQYVANSGHTFTGPVTITAGAISGITDLAIADGGTGASDAATARTNLGLAIGTNVQAYDADLSAIAALTPTDNNFIVGNGTAWVAESGATARTSLGLGDMSTQTSSSVSITGGSVTGITDLAVADGGTGASTAVGARVNLGLGSAALTTYDEGTWDPVIEGTTTAGVGTYTAQVGTYVKIGRMVTITALVTTTAHTGTGNMKISALPFASVNVLAQHPFMIKYTNLTVPASAIAFGYVEANASTIAIHSIATADATSAALALDVACTLSFSCTYMTAP